MTDKKDVEKSGAMKSRRDFLKKTGLGIGAMAAIPAGFLAQVLEVKAAIQADGVLINKAVAAVEANAGKGGRVSLQEQYRKVGGSHSEVLKVMKLVDAKFAKVKPSQRMSRKQVDRMVEDAFIEYVGQGGVFHPGGPCPDHEHLYGVKGSPIRDMLDRGGARLKSHLTSKNVRISGYNAARAPSIQLKQTAPQMKQPSQLNPEKTDILQKR